jgi:hypothetical protein
MKMCWATLKGSFWRSSHHFCQVPFFSHLKTVVNGGPIPERFGSISPGNPRASHIKNGFDKEPVTQVRGAALFTFYLL